MLFNCNTDFFFYITKFFMETFGVTRKKQKGVVIGTPGMDIVFT